MDERALEKLWAATIPGLAGRGAALPTDRTYKPEVPDALAPAAGAPAVAALPRATLRYSQAARHGAAGGEGAGAAGLGGGEDIGQVATLPTMSGAHTAVGLAAPGGRAAPGAPAGPAASAPAPAAGSARPQSSLSGRQTLSETAEHAAAGTLSGKPTTERPGARATAAHPAAAHPAAATGAPSGAAARAHDSGTIDLPAFDPASTGPAIPIPRAAGADALPSYEVIEEIGRGGMGVVYKARQGSLDREVAIKRIAPGRSSIDLKQGFVSEALVTGVLDHPNIVPVYDLGADPDGEVFLAMKLVGGTSWKQLLHPKTEGERARAAEYDLVGHLGLLINVCNAIGFAHSKGIVHRDLKPENVMVGDFGEVLVMDWGIACDYRDQHPAKTRAPHKSTIHRPAGTPAYMAPELAEGRGHDIGPWTDVYLLGAILHEIVTGEPPHVAPTVMAALLSAAESLPPELPASVPEELGEICKKALARDHRERYPTAPELKQALTAFLRHRESGVITDNGLALLARCESAGPRDERARIALYADFAEAVAAFRQAQALWEKNERARAAERRARVAYAVTALEMGDLGLAASQAARLPDDDWERRQLEERIAQRRAERERQRRAAVRVKRSLYVAVLVILLGLAVGFALVRSERDAAVAARVEAEAARAQAEVRRQEAEAARGEAEVARNEAVTQRNAAEAARNDAIAQKVAAERARHAEAEQRAAAESAREAEADQRRLAELRARAAKRAEHAARLEHARVYYDRAFAHLAEGERPSALACALRALELAPPSAVPEGAGDERLAPGQGPAWAREAWLLYRAQSARTPRLASRAAAPALAADAGRGALLAATDAAARRAAFARAGRVTLVRLADLAEERDLAAPDAEPCALALSADGRRVALALVTGEVRVWDAESGAEVARLVESGAPPLMALALSPDGALAALAATDMTARVVAVGAGRAEVARLLDGASAAAEGGRAPLSALAFSDDGGLLLAGDGGGALFLYAAPEWRAAPIDVREAPALRSGVQRVAFAAGAAPSRALATAADGACAAIDVPARRVTRAFAAGARVTSIALDARGASAFVGTASGARLVALASGRVLAALEGHAGAVILGALAEGGQGALTLDARGVWRRFALPPPGEVALLGARPQPLWQAALAPGAAAGALAALAPRAGEPAVHVLAAGGGAGAPAAPAPSPLDGHDDAVLAVALSRDGRVALTGGYDAVVRVYRLDERGRPLGEATLLPAAGGAVFGVAVAPDGRRAAAAIGDGTVRVYDLERAAEVAAFGAPGEEAWQCVAWSPDGARLAAGRQQGGGIELFAVDAVDAGGAGDPGGAGDRSLGRAAGHRGGVRALAFSPDGALLLSASQDGTARLWTLDGREVRRLEGHEQAVHAAAWSPDGLTALTGGADGAARLWDPVTGRELLRLDGHEREVVAVAFAAAGGEALTIDGRGALGRFALAAADIPEAPPDVDLGRADPLEAFRPLYRRLGVEVVRDGPVRGSIAPLAGE